MRIAMVAPTEIPARRANTLQVMKMAQAFAQLGHSVRLAAPHTNPHISPPGGYSWEELARHYGLQQEFPIDWLPARPRLRRYDYSLQAVRWAHQQQADLLYTRLPQTAALGSLLGLPTILEIHDLPQGTGGPWLFRRFLKGRGARRMVVITQALAQDMQQQFGAPQTSPFTLIAPDGVDLDRYTNLPDAKTARLALHQAEANRAGLPGRVNVSIPLERFTAGYTGHLYSGRGADLLTELAARLPGITFLLVGGEPAEVERLRAAAAARHTDNLLLTGFVPNADLPRYQAACDVLLMPYQRRVAASSGGDISRYLSPMKLFEYMACQRPILSSNLPVLQEVLNPANAILLDGEDLQAWSAALLQLQNDAALCARLGQQARQDVERYTWQARAARILDGLPSSKNWMAPPSKTEGLE